MAMNAFEKHVGRYGFYVQIQMKQDLNAGNNYKVKHTKG